MDPYIITTTFDFRSYLDPMGRTYCKVCECFLTLGNDQRSFNHNLLTHINGRKHRNLKSYKSSGYNPSNDNQSDSSRTKFSWEDNLDPKLLKSYGIILYSNGSLYCEVCKCNLPHLSEDFNASVFNIKIHVSSKSHCSKAACHNSDDSTNPSYRVFYSVGKPCSNTQPIPIRPIPITNTTDAVQYKTIDENILADFLNYVPIKDTKLPSTSNIIHRDELPNPPINILVKLASDNAPKVPGRFSLPALPVLGSRSNQDKTIPHPNLRISHKFDTGDDLRINKYFSAFPKIFLINKRFIGCTLNTLYCVLCKVEWRVPRKNIIVSCALVGHLISSKHLNNYKTSVLDIEGTPVQIKHDFYAFSLYKTSVLIKLLLDFPEIEGNFNLNHFLEFSCKNSNHIIVKCLVCTIIFEVDSQKSLKDTCLYFHLLTKRHEDNSVKFDEKKLSDNLMYKPVI